MQKSRKGKALGPYSQQPLKVVTFGDRVRSMRLEWAWTQAELSDALWVSPKTVARWEGAGGTPNPTALKRLEAITGFEPEAWLTGKDWLCPDPPLNLRGHLVPHELAPHVVLLPEGTHGLWHINPSSAWDPSKITLEAAVQMVRDQAGLKGVLYLIRMPA